MKITCLIENTGPTGTNGSTPGLTPKHGLSLFIETRDQTLLFDTGPDQTFLANANHLGLDLKQVDHAFISHGHRDHGGGIPGFQKLNKTAPIYMEKGAMDKFHAKMFFFFSKGIGLDNLGIEQDQCKFISQDTKLNNTMEIFTGFSSQGFIPRGNASLYRTTSHGKKPDNFSHELALLISEDNTTVLFTGCSHSGIGNMVSTVLERTGLTSIDHVIGGFHLFNPLNRRTESRERMDLLIDQLSAFPHTRFITGHCTGSKALSYLQKRLGGQVSALETGARITI